jgi:cysteine protease ATG4
MANVELSSFNRMVQLFWDPEPLNDDPQKAPIWCLGVEYSAAPSSTGGVSFVEGTTPGLAGSFSMIETSHTEDSISSSWESGLAYSEPNGSTSEDVGWPKAFLDDFESKVWMTYRSAFPPIPRSSDPKATAALTLAVRLRNLADQSGFTSDTGWACMIRSGQALLANTLFFLRLGRTWRRGSSDLEEAELLSMFADDPKAPFSIHRFVEHGELACGKHPGEWFGPSASADCIK